VEEFNMAVKIEEATFHYNCGSNVQLSDQSRIAQRTDGFVGIVFTSESIPNGYIFQVKIISEDSEEDWGETLVSRPKLDLHRLIFL
jgi:hypothetical protein